MERQCSAEETLPLLIAHNGRSFDVPFLNLELQRNGLALPRDTLFFDTYRYARQILPQLSIDLASYKQVRSAAFRLLEEISKIEGCLTCTLHAARAIVR
jgi:DNA polymerase III epsilon subunit-like protein